jgi:adenine-specific DNA-methyltransferase
MSEDTQLPLTSPDPAADLLAQLRTAAPQVFSEGRVDFERLRAALGGHVETGAERYGLTWAGKADAFRNVRAPSVGTLLPMPEDSVNWDQTENLIIEGDNLEVLKLLQKPYHGRVKMIYIDPPYNTGNDFIYPDNYRQGLEDYLRFSGQVDEEGAARSTNRDSSGRYHSDWLSMMYPRLFLARNLLRDDGVIFVSIDDNEVHNLRMLMNEVFGEENFLANFVRKRRMPTGMRDTEISPDHEYVISFARSIDDVELVGRTLHEDDYPFQDELGRYRSTDLTIGMTKVMRPNQYYAITNTKTNSSYWPPEQRVWRFEPTTMAKEIANNNIIWPENFLNSRMSRPRYKTRYSPTKTSPISTWIDSRNNKEEESDTKNLVAGMNQEGTKELRNLLGDQILEYPKPASLIRSLISCSTKPDKNDLVLDFFAGSGTTAHSLLELNATDSGNRKFILVQLPEKIDSADYSTIAHITRERVRRVIAKLDREDDNKKSERGFRAFKLSASNFRIWNAERTSDDPAKLAEQLKLYADNTGQARGEQDVLYELILKSGLPLSCKVAPVTVAGVTAWSVDDNKLLVLLNKSATREVLRALIALQPQQLLCLDAAFNGDDALKTSIVLEARSHGITFRTV